MSAAPLSALFGRGADGLPTPEPVAFDRLVLPASPNTCLAAPAGTPGAHVTTQPLPVDAAAAWPALQALGDDLPRVTKLAAWPERRQVQWVARSALMNYPDIIAAELRDGPAGGPPGARLYMYSRSLFGWSDLGVNRKRVEAWLEALNAALRRR